MNCSLCTRLSTLQAGDVTIPVSSPGDVTVCGIKGRAAPRRATGNFVFANNFRETTVSNSPVTHGRVTTQDKVRWSLELATHRLWRVTLRYFFKQKLC